MNATPGAALDVVAIEGILAYALLSAVSKFEEFAYNVRGLLRTSSRWI